MKIKTLKPIWILFILAFLLRIAYGFIVYFYNPTAVFLPDSIGYAKIAENLYNHFAFSQSPDPSNLYPDSMRTPIYPGLLWLMYIFQITIPWLLIFQSFLGAHAVYLVYLICKQFQFTEKVSLGAALLLAINFNSIYFSSAVLTEILFQWLVLFSFYQFNTSTKYGLLKSSLLMGIAFLTRPILTFLPLVLVGIKWFQKGLQKKMMIFLVVFMIFPSLWILRNKLTFNNWMLSPVVELNFFYHLVPEIIPEEQMSEYLNQKEIAEKSQSTKKFVEVTRDYSRTKIKENLGQAFLYVIQNPIKIVAFPIRSYIDYHFLENFSWNVDPSFINRIKNSHWVTKLLLVYQLIVSIICLLGIALSIKYFKRYWLIWTFFLYFILISSISVPDPRFRIPAEPFMAILASIGIFNFLNEKKLKVTASQ